MEDEILSRLLLDLESDRVERKASGKDDKKIRQAICAFANDLPNYQQPGVLFIGINDDGSCANQNITDQLLVNLAGFRSDGTILPFPHLEVKKVTLNHCEMAVVIVQPADAPPVRYEGRVWIRVGPRRAIAPPEEERRLNEKRRFRDLPWDLQPSISAGLEDLDLLLFERVYLPAALAPDILEANQRSLEQQLMSLRFITPASLQPSHLGVLVVGKDPRQFIPAAYIQFVRFEGLELDTPIRDQKEISGSLMDVLHYTDDIVRANITIATDITQGTIEVKKPDYPLSALQQFINNAIMHRSYEATYAPIRLYWFADRIEIHNPGGLFGQVNRENFGQGVTDYRNPYLAEVMKNLGYVQRFGIGIPTAQKVLKNNGNPVAEFTLEATHFVVTVRRSV